MKKRIILVFVFVILFAFSCRNPQQQASTQISNPVKTQKFSDETRLIYNQVMMSIYEDMLKLKKKYKELEDLNPDNIQHNNESGIYNIFYRHGITSLKKNKVETSGEAPFQFSLAIADINDCWQAMNCFEDLKYNNLGIKFYGFYVQPDKSKTDLSKDIHDIVHKNAKKISDYNDSKKNK